MENFKKFMTRHSVLLLSIIGGILLIIVICSFAFGRHGREFGGQKNCQKNFGAGMIGCPLQGEMKNPEGGPGMIGKGGQEAGCSMTAGGPAPMAGGPGMGCDSEGKMQEHMCTSGALQSGAAEHLLVSIDMKINNLELIKKNMQSMAQRTSTEIVTGQLASLDDLIGRFDAQRKILENNPSLFCTESDARKTLNEDMRKIMMEGVSGQVSKFREQGRGGMGMMRWFR